MFNNPRSRSWKALSLILLPAAAAGFVMLNLLIFDIPFEIPQFPQRTGVVPVAICGAAGFMMSGETRREMQND